MSTLVLTMPGIGTLKPTKSAFKNLDYQGYETNLTSRLMNGEVDIVRFEAV